MPFSEFFNLRTPGFDGPTFDVSGGTSTFGDAHVQGQNMNVGGRVGLNYVTGLRDYPSFGGGLSGHYSRTDLQFSPELQKYAGMPQSKTIVDKNIDSLDVSADTPYGNFNVRRNFGGPQQGWNLQWSKKF